MTSRVTRKQMAERLGSVQVFERCTKRDLRILARHLEVATVPPGTELVTQGDQGETFYLVVAGDLVVHQDGRQTATLGPDDHFGELALLDPAPRSATVTAQTEVTVAALSLRMFKVVLRDLPQISGALLGSLAAQLRASRAAGRDETAL